MNLSLRILLPATALLLIITAGCEDEARQQGFEDVVLTGDICPDCAEIHIEYPQMVQESPLQIAIERSIQEEIIEALTLQESGLADDIDEAIESFSNLNRQTNNRYGEVAQWSALIDGEVYYRSDKLIGIRLSFEVNTGGAHGNAYDHLLTFDADKAREIEMNDVLRITPEFVKLAESHFRRDMGLGSNQSLNEAGFIFLGDRFALPETMGLGPNGVFLLYQQGEISSAMDEPVLSIIPYGEVVPFVKDAYKGALIY